MKTIYIISIILIIIIFFLHTKKKEHLLASNEAVNNIAKIYADVSGTVAFNNIKTTGNASVTGNLDVSGVARFNKIAGVDISGGNLDVSGNAIVSGFANFIGRAQFSNGADFKGGINPGNNWTHFPFADGNNYIRGTTIMDGTVRTKGPVIMENGILSDGGKYRLVMQDDGNLVITRLSDNRVIWDSK
jgi:hypothetical protein